MEEGARGSKPSSPRHARGRRSSPKQHRLPCVSIRWICLKNNVVAANGRRSFAATVGSYPGNVGVPKQWYNLIADLSVKPPPMLHPRTHEPLNTRDLAPLFPDVLIRQELMEERFIGIPDELRDVYELWRPTPLIIR
ncbi:Tryptophan synthase beta chain 2 [Hordeum vulgare]|nr:Tryptophan synthase beta chain 2 [Hordeum vulgare]